MKFSFFHLMPYTGLADTPGRSSFGWPVPNRLFDPEKAREYYRAYVDTMIALFRDRVLPEVRVL
jgi:hypothetical protein